MEGKQKAHHLVTQTSQYILFVILKLLVIENRNKRNMGVISLYSKKNLNERVRQRDKRENIVRGIKKEREKREMERLTEDDRERCSPIVL